MNASPLPAHVLGGRCTACGRLVEPTPERYLCPDHSERPSETPLPTLDIAYDYERIAARTNPTRIAA
ncbi:MAG: hypothetical protein RMN24_16200, partial [Anaerolineae bacterium]|nr:hypothetical protein [Anaerolineae bacterium]